MTTDNTHPQPSRRGRRIVRILLVMIAVLILLPLIVPLPPVGVETQTLADADGRFIDELNETIEKRRR